MSATRTATVSANGDGRTTNGYVIVLRLLRSGRKENMAMRYISPSGDVR